jgi:hypothetical protein
LERRTFIIENSNSAVERRQKTPQLAGFSCISTVYVKATTTRSKLIVRQQPVTDKRTEDY